MDAHRDCINDMVIVEGHQRLLMSASRDGVVKAWKWLHGLLHTHDWSCNINHAFFPPIMKYDGVRSRGLNRLRMCAKIQLFNSDSAALEISAICVFETTSLKRLWDSVSWYKNAIDNSPHWCWLRCVCWLFQKIGCAQGDFQNRKHGFPFSVNWKGSPQLDVNKKWRSYPIDLSTCGAATFSPRCVQWIFAAPLGTSVQAYRHSKVLKFSGSSQHIMKLQNTHRCIAHT